jgi:hypothetical protein
MTKLPFDSQLNLTHKVHIEILIYLIFRYGPMTIIYLLSESNASTEYDWASRAKEITAFWDVTSCSLVDFYHRFRGTCCLHVQATSW